MSNKVKQILFIIALIISLLLPGCSSATKSRALVVDCPNEKPSEMNKSGLKNEMAREKILDKINTRRDRNRK